MVRLGLMIPDPCSDFKDTQEANRTGSWFNCCLIQFKPFCNIAYHNTPLKSFCVKQRPRFSCMAVLFCFVFTIAVCHNKSNLFTLCPKAKALLKEIQVSPVVLYMSFDNI